MAYTFPEIRSFAGLFLQQNSFQVPDGAMEIASKIIIRSDEVLSKTYGFFEYWRPDGISLNDDLQATYTYQGKLIALFASGAGYLLDSFPYGGIFNSVGQQVDLTVQNGVGFDKSVNFMEANKNLYMTSTGGIYKMEAFDDNVHRAGIPPGLGIGFDAKNSGFDSSTNVPPDSQAAWRAVFGRRDLNGNLDLGAPTDVVTIGVPPIKVGAAYTVTGTTMTIALPDNYFLQNFGVLSFGPSVTLSNATDPTFNGTQIINAVNFGTSIELNTGSGTTPGTVDVEFGFDPHIKIQIPSELNDLTAEYFVQLYRSSYSDSYLSAPFPDFKLLTEVSLTQQDMNAGYIIIHDDVDSQLLGAELYTNPNTREGENQLNARPPKAKFLSTYKSYAAFANISSVQRAALNLVNPEELIGNDLIFKSDVNEEVYRAVDASVYLPGNVNPESAAITNLVPLRLFLGFTHSFPIGSKVLLEQGLGSHGVTNGEYTVTAVTGTSLTLNTTATSTGLITYQVVSDGTARLYNGYGASGWSFNTVAEWTDFVARDLVRAINANKDSFMYANYVSPEDKFPGKFAIQSKFFIDPIYVRTEAEPISPIFIQNIPFSFLTGIQFFSENDILPNVVYFSKVSEPEAVPIINFFTVGAANSPIVGIFALKDSLIVLKTDGIYKIVGDIIDQFVVTPIDTTVKLIEGMASPANTINNTVLAFCNQGIVQISENSVQVVSRRIEDVIQPLIGRDLSATFLVGHESERLFYVQTEGINPGDAQVTWIYNVLNQQWTSTTDVFSELSLGPDNALFGIRQSPVINKNVLWRQRKTNTRVDWCNEYVNGNIDVAPDLRRAIFTIVSGNDAIPAAGDVILAQGIFNRITSSVPDGGGYLITFAQPSSIPSGSIQEGTLYKGYESKIKMAPFHAGQVSRSKHFAQMQIHLRQQVLTDLTIEFAGAYFGSSEVTNWKSLNVSTAGASGWGFSPWGLFPWGLVDGANLVAGTEPANIIRTYVPRFAARNTFIQPILTHIQAAQPMFVQAIGWTIHGYNERTSR